MKYRKKPVVIEAFQYDGDLTGSTGKYYVPAWAIKAFESDVMYYGSERNNEPPFELYIDTLEGTHHVSVGDYIIQGVNGEIYPCKPDIFLKTYEVLEAPGMFQRKKQMELKDTIKLMESADYKDRFKAEYYQLKIRYLKLKEMIDRWENGLLDFTPTCPISVYDFQLNAMNDYLEILEERAVMEGIDLSEDTTCK